MGLGRAPVYGELVRLRGPLLRVAWHARGVCAVPHSMRELERTPPDKALAELAVRQWGVVSVAQLQALGIGRSAVTRRVQAGRLRRVHRGVYAVGGAVLPREGRWLAAVLACGDRAVLSHLSAAVHWNLLHYDAPRPEVTAPASRRRVSGIRLHRSRFLDAQDTTIHEGIPVTTVHRTLLDLAADAPDHHLERALAQAERLRLYDQRADRRRRSPGPMATKAPSASRTRSRPTRNGRAASWSAACAGSPATTSSRGRCAITPSTPPTTPASRLDFYFPSHHLVVETDGWATHHTRQSLRGRPRQGRRADRRRLHRHALHLAPAPRRPADRRRAHQSGMFPCFRFGACTRFVSSVSSAVMTFGRVSWGTMTSSRYPRSAAA